MTRAAADRRGRRSTPAPRSGDTGRRGWAVVGVLAMVTCAAVGAGLWWWRTDTRVGKVRGIEQALLAGQLPGRAGRRAIDEIVRTVDRMRPEELKTVKQALEEEWQRLCQEDLEAFRIATTEEQTAILDRSIQRGLVYQELQFAVNPRAGSKNYRRPRKPAQPPAASQASSGGDQAAANLSRQDRDRFREAVLKRARERRIDVPVWQEPAGRAG